MDEGGKLTPIVRSLKEVRDFQKHIFRRYDALSRHRYGPNGGFVKSVAPV
jgi:hypothetical protein